MNRKPLLISLCAVLFLTSTMAMAKPKDKDKPKKTRVPEISVESGTSAIALLSGMLLLAGERVRSRRI
ncbi:MAG: VPEID-CTERM sorting domain-containing protein [Methylococcaceae bacterium]|nr:VPEID-CTERM sorting domain-containing protein [Methylococcaceae bacterium]